MSLLQALGGGNCSARSIPYPIVPGAVIRSLQATQVYKSWQYIPAGVYSNNPAVTASDLSWCNITITYTPLDSTRLTTVQVWLPKKWNNRMQGLGGSGWAAGLTDYGLWGMTAVVAQGYAAIATNGGTTSDEPRDWAFSSPGKIDMKALEHWSSTSLNDLAIIGKSLVKSFYGQPPMYSYWNGCSQGGRQGFMLAQKYPTAFDGIAAAAPPVLWGPLMIAGFWAQALMNELRIYPDPCEFGALTAAAIKHCDPLDGVTDGMISDPDNCHFDPYTMVNTTTTCSDGTTKKISKGAAQVIEQGWYGMKKSVHPFLHYGANHDAPLATAGVPILGSLLYNNNFSWGLADITCNKDGTGCIGKPHKMVDDWIKVFVLKDGNYNASKIGLQGLDDVFEKSVLEYTAIVGTSSVDLSAFRKAGGKILSYHGSADPIIPSRNSRRYYEAAKLEDHKVDDFFRYFEAPGVGHCFSGTGLYPAGIFDSLVRWRERGEAPDKLVVDTSSFIGPSKGRILCPHPQRSRYKGSGDTNTVDSYYCA